jgi:NADPH-dependent curcumin reductase CurA
MLNFHHDVFDYLQPNTLKLLQSDLSVGIFFAGIRRSTPPRRNESWRHFPQVHIPHTVTLIFMMSIRTLVVVLAVASLAASNAATNEMVVLAKYADEGALTNDHFKTVVMPLTSATELKENEVLLKVEAISVDPYMRARFRSVGMDNYFVGPFEIGQPITSTGLAKVIASSNANFTVGDYVSGFLPWKRYHCIDGAEITKAPKFDKFEYYLKFVFGINIAPLSAWMPIRQLWPRDSVKEGCTAYVSGAAGAVGVIAGQILKNIYNCRY